MPKSFKLLSKNFVYNKKKEEYNGKETKSII